MLVKLVWKPARISSAVSLSTVKVVSNWSNQKRKSPSRLQRDAKRLQSFQMAKLATKQSIGPVNLFLRLLLKGLTVSGQILPFPTLQRVWLLPP